MLPRSKIVNLTVMAHSQDLISYSRRVVALTKMQSYMMEGEQK